MLHVYYGKYTGRNYISDPDIWFDNQAELNWLTENKSKEMIRDIDRSDVISPYLIQSSRLGPIPYQWLSGGVKTLILIDHDARHVFNASACGDNCAGWLLEIGKRKDVLIRLGYLMDFGKVPFDILIENTGETVHDMKTLIHTVVKNDLLENDHEQTSY